jgi:hypothetical protein
LIAAAIPPIEMPPRNPAINEKKKELLLVKAHAAIADGDKKKERTGLMTYNEVKADNEAEDKITKMIQIAESTYLCRKM